MSESFGSMLRRHRLSHGLTQEALAERALLSATAIAALERGRNRAPRLSTLRQMARALDLTGAESWPNCRQPRRPSGCSLRPGRSPPAVERRRTRAQRAARLRSRGSGRTRTGELGGRVGHGSGPGSGADSAATGGGTAMADRLRRPAWQRSSGCGIRWTRRCRHYRGGRGVRVSGKPAWSPRWRVHCRSGTTVLWGRCSQDRLGLLPAVRGNPPPPGIARGRRHPRRRGGRARRAHPSRP